MISIIIPVLNEEKLIASALEHLRQIRGQLEVIVVDGGSSDSTVEIAGKLAQVVAGPRGRGAQMNAGAQRAQGDTLLFLHADTLLPPEAINFVEEAMADSRVVGGRFKVSLDSCRPIYRIIGGMINLRDRFTQGFTGDQAIFIRKDVFERLDGYQEVALLEDLDLARRMRRAGKIIRLPLCVTTSTRRWEREGVWRTILLMWALRILYLLNVSPKFLQRFYGEAR